MKPLLGSTAIGWQLCRFGLDFVHFSCTWPLNVSVALSVPFLNYHTQSTKNGNYSVISRLGLANGILFMGSFSITFELGARFLLVKYLKRLLLWLLQETCESTKVADGLWVVPKWRTPPVCIHIMLFSFIF